MTADEEAGRVGERRLPPDGERRLLPDGLAELLPDQVSGLIDREVPGWLPRPVREVLDDPLDAAIPQRMSSLLPDEVLTASFDPQRPGVAAPARRWWGRPVLEQVSWQAELARLLVDPVWRGTDIPEGDGGPVMTIPGFLAGDASLAVLRGWLRRMGHDPHPSGVRLNVDCSDRALAGLERRLRSLAAAAGRPVALVGHSRGGHLARALASRDPQLVSRVVTLASPLGAPLDISLPTKLAVVGVRSVLTRVSRTARDNGCFTETCRCPFTRDYRKPWPESVPLTSLYTRQDGVVWWEACLVDYGRSVEVAGSHVGLAFNRHAYRAIGEALAA